MKWEDVLRTAHSPEQILKKLKQVEVSVAKGKAEAAEEGSTGFR